ncbi:hypothetical protein [Mycolicibacterium llatzerense]|uniref:hypothetical protein n=1 Tax=Mycolicibacterium llatzerense TaxID=280871 RepID=UPI0021B6C39E|nr:hypothetical protein [Mycolicibacterium llatzerense]
MDIVLPRGDGPKATLQTPSEAGYLLLAANVERRAPFLPRSRGKRALIDAVSSQLAELAHASTVKYADLFIARLVASDRRYFSSTTSTPKTPNASFPYGNTLPAGSSKTPHCQTPR